MHAIRRSESRPSGSGALAAIAVCLLSGRRDWRERVIYFAFFGALGWTLGSSMAYTHPIAYTHSGHFASQLHGFASLFLIGFLWAGLGAAGTAYPAVVSRDRLTEIFHPLLWVLAVGSMGLLLKSLWITPYLVNLNPEALPQANPLYWMDSNWLPALAALVTVCAFDLWERRFKKLPLLALFATLGALVGYLLKGFSDWTGISRLFRWVFVRTQGDIPLIQSAEEVGVYQAADTEPQLEFLGAYEGEFDTLRDNLLTNWPAFLHGVAIQHHLGWILGLVVGVALYFRLHGAFRSGARLILYLALGWLAGFILLPVILGLRMAPPQNENWAGVLGAFCALMIYCFRTRIPAVAYASIISGTVGGIGFVSATLLKLALLRPGSTALTGNPTSVGDWSHWKNALCHVVLEHSYGLINGIGLAIAMGILTISVRRVDDDPPARTWTQPFALSFVLLFVIYVSGQNALSEWLYRPSISAALIISPFEGVSISVKIWFAILFWIAAGGFTALAFRQTRTPIPLVPATALGKGQLLFVTLLATPVLFNLLSALQSNDTNPIVTQGVIAILAMAATVLLIRSTREYESQTHIPPLTKTVPYQRAIVIALLAFLGAVAIGTTATRALYGNTHAGHSGHQLRFGPDAEWRVNPITRTRPHD